MPAQVTLSRAAHPPSVLTTAVAFLYHSMLTYGNAPDRTLRLLAHRIGLLSANTTFASVGSHGLGQGNTLVAFVRALRCQYLRCPSVCSMRSLGSARFVGFRVSEDYYLSMGVLKRNFFSR
ncbi:hypothetical protein LX32DRAFT_147253 [Colletotrichum zoysiae]|uniref:Uncharacterized protein n=1 Tax=Colletotrichum zoysiae TaxID=1216348 RepID=A0AAD9H8I4_9PEZI|nr:hypothetical protein LX32DRAFT_147253 [Colletotrichum zoysiae]